MQKYSNTLADKSGNVQAGVQVTVYRVSTGLLATLYSDHGGTALQANPFYTDVNGHFEFYAADGVYDINTRTANGDELWDRDVVLADLRGGVGDSGGSGGGVFTNVKDYGAVPGDTNDDYSQIQTAINAATGTTIIDDGGTYIVGNTLKVASDSELIVGPAAVLKLKAGTNKPLLTNVSYLAPKTTVTVTSSGLTATVTWTNHGKGVGDAFALTGSTAAPELMGAWTVASAPNGDQITFRLDKSYTTGSPISCQASDADKNIRIDLKGELDGNYSQQTSLDDNNRHLIIMHNVVGLRISGGTMRNVDKYAIYLVNCRDFEIEDVNFDTQFDCVHVSANCRNGTIRRPSGYTVAGSIVAATLSNPTQYKIEDGNITGLSVLDANATNASQVVKLSGKTGYKFDDIVVADPRGATQTNVTVLVADSSPSLVGTMVDKLTVKDVRNQQCTGVVVVGLGAVVDTLVIDKVSAACVDGGVVGSVNGTVRRLLGSNVNASGTGTGGGVIFCDGTLTYLNLTNVSLDETNKIGWVVAHATASPMTANISNVAGATADDNGLLIGNGPANVMLNNIQLNSTAVLVKANAAGANITASLRNCATVTNPVVIAAGTAAVLGNTQQQAVTYATSITPDLYKGNVVNVGVLANSITINNPAAVPPAGELVQFMFDVGTYTSGTRAVTWGTSYVFPTAFTQAVVTTDTGKKTIVTFRSNGSKLFAIGGNAWA